MKPEAPARLPWILSLRPPEPRGAEEPGSPDPARGARPDAGEKEVALPADTLGLALAGTGVNGAAFCLGVLQSLARGGWLRRVDYLSTVGGGGFVGAYLGRFFDLCYKPGGVTGAVPNRAPGAAHDRVVHDLSDSRSPSVEWLRRHANYLSPTGLGEVAVNAAAFWRNLLSVYFVLAFFFLALFGGVHAVGYGNHHGAVVSLVYDLVATLTPLSARLPPTLAGPWATLAELVIWVAVLPLMAAYWLVSQDLPEAFTAPVLVAAALLAVALLLATFSPLGIVVLAAAVFWALGAWAAVRRREGHADPFNPIRLLSARNRLTDWLAFWVAVAAGLAALGLVDALGKWLARLMLEGGLTATNVVGWVLSLVGTLLGLAAALRLAAGALVAGAPRVAGVFAVPRPYLWAGLLLACGAVPPLVVVSFVSHAAYETGEAYRQGLWFTLVAAAVSLLLGSASCVPFINRSGPLAVHGGRLARAFLGAVNPERRVHPEGRNVTYVVPGDDVPFEQYRPDLAGGPIHLINCAVSETVDVASQRGLRDRPAENLAVGPAGVNVARRWHALWDVSPAAPPRLVPLATEGPHPFLGRAGEPVEVEPLNLREWTAISGAASNSVLRRFPGPARALLLTLANLRLGYWWDSGLNVDERRGVPVGVGLWAAVIDHLSRWFRAQSLLLSELAGRFGGPWYRYWYLSGGDNFEATGAYELLRRRVPFIVICDAGQDGRRHGNSLARLVRLARIDLGAEVEEAGADPDTLQKLGVPEAGASRLGGLADLLPGGGGPARKHAALLLVRYPRGPRHTTGGGWAGRRHTWLLYLTATLTGDEPADVRNYAALNPSFPNETPSERVPDEPQWESYRKLGEHVGNGLFL